MQQCLVDPHILTFLDLYHTYILLLVMKMNTKILSDIQYLVLCVYFRLAFAFTIFEFPAPSKETLFKGDTFLAHEKQNMRK